MIDSFNDEMFVITFIEGDHIYMVTQDFNLSRQMSRALKFKTALEASLYKGTLPTEYFNESDRDKMEVHRVTYQKDMMYGNNKKEESAVKPRPSKELSPLTLEKAQEIAEIIVFSEAHKRQRVGVNTMKNFLSDTESMESPVRRGMRHYQEFEDLCDEFGYDCHLSEQTVDKLVVSTKYKYRAMGRNKDDLF
jgi:ribosome-binding ATPase YchF (GTP1/OBG family)